MFFMLDERFGCLIRAELVEIKWVDNLRLSFCNERSRFLLWPNFLLHLDG